jgi:hypothetical protein
MRENAVVVYNGYIYNIGGLNASGTTLANVYYATINSNGTIGTWNSTTSLPQVMRAHSAVAYNGYLYTFGGYTGSAPLATVYYAPINSDGTIGTWNTTTSLTEAKAIAQSAVVYNGYMYVIGGYAVPNNTDKVHYALINSNGTLGTWTQTTSLPFTTYTSIRAVAYRGYLYAIRNYSTGSYDGALYYAPINSNATVGSWSTGPTPSYTSQFAIAISPGGYLYALGGDNGSTVTNAVRWIKINADGTPGAFWTSATSLPANRRWGGAAYYKNYVYYLGGTDSTTTTESYHKADVYYSLRQ